MKILITGATGKVGSRLVPRMLAKGHEVHILVRDAAKASALVNRGAMIITGDLFQTNTLPPAVSKMA